MEIKFSTDSAAFNDEHVGKESRYMEAERILKDIIAKMKWGQTEGKVIDLNGNTVGSWKM
jgi:hypothetical protein